MHVERAGNLLGATALAVADLALADVRRAGEVSASGAAALVVLSTSPGLSITELGWRVGLSQSAAVRMVDSLQADELVFRHPAAGRRVDVELTAKGQRAAAGILSARSRSLTELVSVLDGAEQEVLAALLVKLLTRLYLDVGSSDLLCRLCDRSSCTRDAVCPVGQAERDQES
jgi:DNA-binding MarR family transcriptional regulator